MKLPKLSNRSVLRASVAGVVATMFAMSAAAETNVEFIAGVIGDPFYNSMECGAREAAAEFGVTLSWTGPTDWDIAKQQPFIDAAVQNAPDAMIIAPTDSRALITQIQQLVSDGIPVITVDAPLDEPVEVQTIQSNHYEGGKAAAEAMKIVAGTGGSYIVLGLKPGLPDIDARVNGFTENLGGGNILPTLYPETSTSRASEQVAAAILSTPDLKGIYATHFSAATGAAAAILQAGRQGDIKLVAFDAAPQQVRDLKDGIYDALVVQEPHNMGYESVKLAAQIASGEVDLASVEHDNFLGSVIATRDNMNDADVAKFFYAAACKR